MLVRSFYISFFFFFNDTATTEIYTLSLHDALPIFTFSSAHDRARMKDPATLRERAKVKLISEDRKSTRLNSSHGYISYAVFCLKKKKNITQINKTCVVCRYFLIR